MTLFSLVFCMTSCWLTCGQGGDALWYWNPYLRSVVSKLVSYSFGVMAYIKISDILHFVYNWYKLGKYIGYYTKKKLKKKRVCSSHI